MTLRGVGTPDAIPGPPKDEAMMHRSANRQCASFSLFLQFSVKAIRRMFTVNDQCHKKSLVIAYFTNLVNILNSITISRVKYSFSVHPIFSNQLFERNVKLH